jgi:endonuclease YncB( thermonuclease family)
MVTGVTDGDTIEVEIGGETYELRYIGIDCPERGEVFCDEATEANRALVMGKQVRLEKDVSETDRYGRLLRYVYLEDGTLVNEELVRQGFAIQKGYPPDTKQQEVLESAESVAREQGLGLWAIATPTPTVTATSRPTNTAEPATATPVATGTTTPPAATATPQPAKADVQIVKVYNEGRKEYVEIANLGTAAATVGGWSVSGSKGDERYRFPDGYTLGPGTKVRLHSGENGVDAPPADIWWVKKCVWNNKGETVFLWDSSGAEADSYGY